MRHGIHTTTGLVERPSLHGYSDHSFFFRWLTWYDYQAWHSDMGAEVLALHVRSLAEKGGNTFVASSWTIFKELEKSHPRALETLRHPSWPLQM